MLDSGQVLGESPVATGSAAGSPGGSPSIYLIHETVDCIVCGDVRPEIAVLHGDPFCRTKCARAWYGCPLDPASERPEKRVA